VKFRNLLVIALLGAYVNAVGFGFAFGVGNHAIQLPHVNWLKDPSLYPGDSVTGYFLRYPSFFWHAIAFGAKWADVQTLLFLTFTLTKVIFFLALVHLVSIFISDLRIIATICITVALSPVLNSLTPFGYSDLLEALSTHSSLAVALLFWLAPCLIERRWLAVGVLLGVTAHINAMFVLYALFGVAVFAFIDQRRMPLRIVGAGVIFAALFSLWALLSSGKLPAGYPSSYVETLLMIYPQLVTLRFHPLPTLIHGASIVAGACLVILILRRLQMARNRRLELLALVFVIPVLMGALIGEFFPHPQLMRLQFLRADTFLVLFCVLCIQIYGAKVVTESGRRPATAIFTAVAAILFPLSQGLGYFLLLAFACMLWFDKRDTFENLIAWAAGKRLIQYAVAIGAVAGLGVTIWVRPSLRSDYLLVLAAFGGAYLFSALKRRSFVAAPHQITSVACCLALLIAFVGAVPRVSSLWNPVTPPDSMMAAWIDVQQWAKQNTARDDMFLVPPHPGGFRAFSERPVWTEHKDKDMIFTYPEYTDTWRSRIAALGVRLNIGLNRQDTMLKAYQAQSWSYLSGLARENNAHFIVQFTDVSYDQPPVFENAWFKVYRSSPPR
jgi:hypothetical protein